MRAEFEFVNHIYMWQTMNLFWTRYRIDRIMVLCLFQKANKRLSTTFFLPLASKIGPDSPKETGHTEHFNSILDNRLIAQNKNRCQNNDSLLA